LRGYARLFLLVLLALYASYSTALIARLNGPASPSPLNPGLLGTSKLAGILSGMGFEVSRGSLADVDPTGVYVVVGPERGYTPAEAGLFEELLRRGLRAVVADETGVANTLISRLGFRVSGSYLVRGSAPPGWGEVVRIECPGGPVFTSTRVSYIDSAPPGAEFLCWAVVDGARYPVVARYRLGRGVLVVVSDSSVFTNFMVEGRYGYLSRPTRGVVEWILSQLGPPGGPAVLESRHYRTYEVRLAALARASSFIASAILSDLRGSLRSASPYKAFAPLALVPLAASAMLVGLPIRGRGEPSETESSTASSVALVALKRLRELARRAGGEAVRRASRLAWEYSRGSLRYEDALELARRVEVELERLSGRG